MRILSRTILGAALLVATPALAAEPVPANGISVTVSTSMSFEGSTTTAEEEAALQAKAREQLYKIASGECPVIVQTMNADCKLRQVQVNTRTMRIDAVSSRLGRDGVTATGNFTFVLTPRP